MVKVSPETKSPGLDDEKKQADYDEKNQKKVNESDSGSKSKLKVIKSPMEVKQPVCAEEQK